MSRFIIVCMIVAAYAITAYAQEEPLYQAVLADDVELVTQMLKSGEDPNREFRNRVVPLHLCKSEKMGKLLLEHGAFTEKHTSRQKLTPLEVFTRDYALARKSYPEGIEKRKLIDLLLQNGAVYTDLAAVYLDDVEYFRDKVAQGKWGNSERSADWLRTAIECGNSNLVSFLLESGVEPNGPATNPHLTTALDKPHLFKLLLNHGASVHHRVKRFGGSSGTAHGDHLSILHLACRLGSTSAVPILIEHGADPNSQDSLGQTPLHFVAIYQTQAQAHDKPNYTSIAKLLIERGAVAEMQDNEGRTPYQVALSLEANGMPADGVLLDLLKESRDNMSNPLGK